MTDDKDMSLEESLKYSGYSLIGAGIGALVAGPVGLVIGGGIGFLIGMAVNSENETEGTESVNNEQGNGSNEGNGETEE